MLMGEFQHNMDAKGRVTIPARFREDLGDCFYVTKGLDGCLFVLSPAQWEQLLQRMAGLPLSKARTLQRFFFSGASEAEPDKQGRVLIPPHLREYAGLTKDITVIGAATRAEIWDTEKWKEYNAGQSQESILQAMELLDF